MKMLTKSKAIAIVALITNFLWATSTAGADPAPQLPNPATGKSGPPEISFKVPPNNQPGAQPQAVFLNVHCAIKVDYPHKSKHEPTTINVEATVTCDPPGALTIGQIVTLYRAPIPGPNVPVGTGIPGVGAGTSLTSNAAAPCINGSYFGAADAALTFPPISIPPAGAIGNFGPTVDVTDCPI